MHSFFRNVALLHPRMVTVAAVVAMLAVPLASRAQERAVPDSILERPRPPKYDAGQPVLRKVLKNGVTLMVQEQRTTYSVAGVVAVRMGTRYETEDNSGLGRILARTMLAGTNRSSASDFQVRLKGTNSSMDALVGTDVGQIWIKSDREHAAGAASLLADVVVDPSLPDTAFEAERVRASTDATFAAESPLPVAYGEFLTTVYAGTPYQRHLQGLVTPIARARRSDIAALHRTLFVGGNMTVLFVGNLDAKKVMGQLEKAFATVPAGRAPDPAGPEPQPLAADTVIVKEYPWLAHAYVLGFPAPGYADPDFAAFAILDSYLRSEDRSPITFWMKQREEAVSPGVAFAFFPSRASLAVYFGVTPAKLAAARDTARAIVTRLRIEPLDKGEWNVQLRRVQNGFFMKQDDPLFRALDMSRWAAEGLPPDYPKVFETRLLKLTPEAVRAAAERWLTHSCEVILGPAPPGTGDSAP